MPPLPIDVWFVLPRGSLILDWAGPAETLRFANTEQPGQQPAFHLRFAAPQGESTSSVGALIAALEPLPESLQPRDWVVLVGRTSVGHRCGDGEPDRDDELVIDWLRRVRPGEGGTRLVTVCSGALLAASAGLLRGRRATTHHGDLDELARRAPDATVVADRVFVHDGDLWSSAGVTAGIDLALHLVALHSGPVVAARVAQRMAVALRRGPDDPQLSPFLAHRQHLNARLHRVQDAVSRAPGEGWTLARMAEEVHTTPRSLSRLFQQHAGVTPLAYLRGIRLALARVALEAGASVSAAAEAAGFASDLQLRRAWHAAGWPGTPGGLGSGPGSRR